EAENAQQAAVKLSGMGLYTLSLEEETAAFIKKSRGRQFFIKGVPLRDLSNFTRQLSNLLDSGLTILNALGVLIEQTDSPELKHTIGLLRDDVRDGATYSAALKKHPKIFSTLYVNMVGSGEISGTLEDVLRRLSDFLEKDEDTVSKIRASLAYPALMAFVGFITIFVLLSFVAPRLTAIFIDLGQALPLPTKLLIAISGFFAKFWIFILVGIAALIFTFNRWSRTKEGKAVFDKFKLKVPVIGPFIQKGEIARFGRTLGTLISNGVPIVQALGVANTTIGNDIIRQELDKARKDVVEGAPLSKSIRQSKNFPSMMINMIAVGEESGTLERSLFKIADAYDTELDRSIKTLTSMIEPALILFMGIVVGFIVIAMLLPIFQLNMMVR
ncbi:MAG: type II secretion system F family protein, partial [Candidatus Omnitrophica bacterium]|nr:type II secretion system F family protein [Candidatus Omnitrophota bacterium]